MDKFLFYIFYLKSNKTEEKVQSNRGGMDWNNDTVRIRRSQMEKSININEEFLTRHRQQQKCFFFPTSFAFKIKWDCLLVLLCSYACTSLYRFCFFIYHKICFNVKEPRTVREFTLQCWRGAEAETFFLSSSCLYYFLLVLLVYMRSNMRSIEKFFTQNKSKEGEVKKSFCCCFFFHSLF